MLYNLFLQLKYRQRIRSLSVWLDRKRQIKDRWIDKENSDR